MGRAQFRESRGILENIGFFLHMGVEHFTASKFRAHRNECALPCSKQARRFYVPLALRVRRSIGMLYSEPILSLYDRNKIKCFFIDILNVCFYDLNILNLVSFCREHENHLMNGN